MGETYDDSERLLGPGPVQYAPCLVVLLECDRPLAGGARYSLLGIERVRIGRGDSGRSARRVDDGVGTLELKLPGKSLSAAHAQLVRVGPSWAIEDLGSTNGTFVDGERVSHRVLAPGALFEVGHVLLRINSSVSALVDAPLDVETDESSLGPQVTLDADLSAQFEALRAVAASDLPILVEGESGTGKEGTARWAHEVDRRRGAFVAVNCGAIPAALVESTFFGHVRGAFSGATRDATGLVRAATGGTLFLDEVADLRSESQAALLRVLQEHEVVPVGGTHAVPVDFRVVAATHARLEECVAAGTFRRDLFARIAGFTVRLPALRDRLDDFGILVSSLVRRLAHENVAITLEPEAGRALLAYSWPLNIRELEQCLARSIALAGGNPIAKRHLPEQVLQGSTAPNDKSPPLMYLNERDTRIRDDLLGQLSRHGGNLADVARAMGKARMQIHRWCRRFGIDPNAYRT
jgi:transcriptional regulator with PAS, ATPase and Fis domain